MEKRREAYWVTYLTQFNEDISGKLANSKIFDPECIANIISDLNKQIIPELDMILSTGLVWIVRSENSPVGNKYDKLFADDYNTTLKIFNDSIPCLMSHITRRIYLYRDGINRLIERLTDDWGLIKDTFVTGRNRISSLNVSMGDLHGAGNQTSLIKITEDIKIIYKPVSLEIDIIAYDLIQIIADFINYSGLGEKPKILTRNNYGYVSYINPKNITDDKGAINAVYEQIAFLLSMACLLGIGDMHAENILISIPNVYLLDLETAFYTSEEIKDYTIYDNEINPVSRSGMLLDVYDIPPVVGLRTGIQGGEFPINARTIPKIINDGTDGIEIKYIRDIPVETVFHHNRLYHANGRIVSIFLTEDRVIKDFEEFYSTLLDKKEVIKSIVRCKLCNKKFASRRIFCPTSMYRNFISIQQHIESYVNPLNFYWSKMLEQLARYRKTEHQHMLSFVRNNELLDLNEGLIPYFFRKNDDKNLYHISGAVMMNAYEKNIEEELLSHIDKLPPVNKLLKYIKNSYESVRNLKTPDDLKNILEYHQKRRNGNI